MNNPKKIKQNIRLAYVVIVSDNHGDVMHTFKTLHEAEIFYQIITEAQKRMEIVHA